MKQLGWHPVKARVGSRSPRQNLQRWKDEMDARALEEKVSLNNLLEIIFPFLLGAQVGANSLNGGVCCVSKVKVFFTNCASGGQDSCLVHVSFYFYLHFFCLERLMAAVFGVFFDLRC